MDDPLSNTEFWLQATNRLIELELKGLSKVQQGVIVEMRKDLERFMDWSMSDDEAAQVHRLPCQHSGGYRIQHGETICVKCGEGFELSN